MLWSYLSHDLSAFCTQNGKAETQWHRPQHFALLATLKKLRWWNIVDHYERTSDHSLDIHRSLRQLGEKAVQSAKVTFAFEHSLARL